MAPDGFLTPSDDPQVFDDGVLLQSVANGLFLHADSLRFDTGSLEVNGAAMGSPFTLTLFRSAAEAQASELRAGELVRMRSACAARRSPPRRPSSSRG